MPLFFGQQWASSAPGLGHAAITPSDSVPVDFRSLYVGGTGDVKLTAYDGSVAIWKSVPAGFVIPMRVSLVWSTGTTATNILGIL